MEVPGIETGDINETDLFDDSNQVIALGTIEFDGLLKRNGELIDLLLITRHEVGQFYLDRGVDKVHPGTGVVFHSWELYQEQERYRLVGE